MDYFSIFNVKEGRGSSGGSVGRGGGGGGSSAGVQ